MREYEKHQAANGHPPSHAFAKELLAGIAAAEVFDAQPVACCRSVKHCPRRYAMQNACSKNTQHAHCADMHKWSLVN